MKLRILIPVALLGAAGAIGAACLGGCNSSPAQAQSLAPPVQLTILTPHDQAITNAFTFGFSRWYYDKHKQRVGVRVIKRGTLECLDYLDSVFGRSSESGATPPDLLFGGGIKDHEYVAAAGYSRAIDLKKECTEIPAEIAGLPTRDPQGHWYGTGLSCFGIYYNELACKQRGIAPPQSWEDLAKPEYFGWIGVADPARSGSTREAMQIILQKHGWEKGWPLITAICANARGFSRSSGEALNGVEDGIFLGTIAVNFEGLRRARQHGGRTAYINPAGATTASPDVISVLNGNGQPEAAIEFVRYALSPEGQLVWAAEASAIGEDPLYHYPILPSSYQAKDKLVLSENPFEKEFGVRFDLALAERNANSLLPLLTALAESNHVQLQAAHQSALLQSDAQAGAQRWAEAVQPPFGESQAAATADQYRKASADQRRELRAQWSNYYGQRLGKNASTGESG